MEKRPVPIIIVMITQKGDERILMIKRNYYPYKGYWSMIGGKLEGNESVREAVLREVREETGLEAEFLGIKSVIHERLMENGISNFTSVIFFCHAEVGGEDVIQSHEGELEWFRPDGLDGLRMVHSDKWMIENLSEKSIEVPHVIMEEREGEIVSFREL